MSRNLLVAALAAVLATLAGPPSRAEQAAAEWRPVALASFDEVWQTIDDTFYDPGFGGLDWNAVRAELRPRAEAAASADDVRRVIAEMLARLKRSHFVVLSPDAAGERGPMGPASVPIEVRVADTPDPQLRPGLYVVVTRVESGSTAQRAGIGPGVLLSEVDGVSVLPAIESAARAGDGRARAFDAWRRATRALHGPVGSRAEIKGSKRGRDYAVTVARGREAGAVVTLGNLPPLPVRTDAREIISPARRRIGVVAFNVWMTPIDVPIAEAIDKFRKADGLVIDLRGNPGGLAVMISGVAGHLLNDANTLLGKLQTRQGPLEFRPNPRRSTPDGRRVTPYGGPVGLLVDELTGSASECFAGALQSLGRVRVFGRQTMGEALPALTKRLPNGDVLMYAIGDFVTATGRSMEGTGVIPDERISLSADALARGQDPDLDAAVRWMDRRK